MNRVSVSRRQSLSPSVLESLSLEGEASALSCFEGLLRLFMVVVACPLIEYLFEENTLPCTIKHSRACRSPSKALHAWPGTNHAPSDFNLRV
jgi:hypothetical protein